MNYIYKITPGFVTQTFDENGKHISSDFTPGDDIIWENEWGDIIDNIEDHPAFDNYIPYIME